MRCDTFWDGKWEEGNVSWEKHWETCRDSNVTDNPIELFDYSEDHGKSIIQKKSNWKFMNEGREKEVRSDLLFLERWEIIITWKKNILKSSK
jgi:hypothetical protein